MAPSSSRTLLLLGALALGGFGCIGGSDASSSQVGGEAGSGPFLALDINISDGDVWEINRLIRIEFNRAVDPDSISFSSILIQPQSSEIQGVPVTGQFEIEAGSEGKVVLFQPSCPTSETHDNGALIPGGYTYQLSLPTAAQSSTVLRDVKGKSLSLGLTRNFTTPGSNFFVDYLEGPPLLEEVTFPSGLNFFTSPDPIVEIRFNQSIDGRAANLTSERLRILYSAEEIPVDPSGFTFTYPAANVLPGTFLVAENCRAAGGAVLHFYISGLLPVNRMLKLEVDQRFRDIVGQETVTQQEWTPFATPALSDVYSDWSWIPGTPTVDEFSDTYESNQGIDLSAGLSHPLADIGNGAVTASFDFPGQFVPEDADFYFASSYQEIFTDGNFVFTTTNAPPDHPAKVFNIQNGVLYCDDFEIAAFSTLRIRGSNPFKVFATGTVEIYGALEVTGNDAQWPTALNSPQFPAGGAGGEGGGGDGGTASIITTAETLRGQDGDGPFVAADSGGGGQGGEGGFQQSQSLGSGSAECKRLLAGGGGGGTFARTYNRAIVWEGWTTGQRPASVDGLGPGYMDHRIVDHPRFPVSLTWPDPTPDAWPADWDYRWETYAPLGGEDGIRGAAYETQNAGNPPDHTWGGTHGIFGMEDQETDYFAEEGGGFSEDWDAHWELETDVDPPFQFGHPTFGPDPGSAGPSPFANDANWMNDFYGKRLDSVSGVIATGEILMPLAGSGGGASGDSQVITRENLGAGVYASTADRFPDVPFRTYTNYYRVGAPGGGGGGQLQIQAIGPIIIGHGGKLDASGGIGMGGESTIYTYSTISGSGGGSGGHIILQSATEFDFTNLNFGSGSTIGELDSSDNIQAFGGRRGWAGAWIKPETRPSGTGTFYDGNQTFMAGRGGAGGNGVIQIHVPDPLNNIKWPAAQQAMYDNYVTQTHPEGDTNRIEQFLELVAEPIAYCMVPLFSSSSQFQSEWVDTGLAYLHLDLDGSGQETNTYPDYSHASMLRFLGIDSSGDVVVDTATEKVEPLVEIATGSTSDASYAAAGFAVTVSSAQAYFDADLLRNPNIFLGYDFFPDASLPSGYEIVDVEFDLGADEITFTSRTTDGPLTFAVGSAWKVIPKFFRVDTAGTKDGMPASTRIRFEFQGADESSPGSNEPGTVTAWTADLADLQGLRFIRYRATFFIDEDSSGIEISSPRPSLDFIKIPIVW
ncbi:MAG TPA: hypothetical protein DDW23_03145 [Planctomycetes bacterium]|nr:hypothetical protein [Planctomycetota bacterium]